MTHSRAGRLFPGNLIKEEASSNHLIGNLKNLNPLAAWHPAARENDAENYRSGRDK